MLEASQELIWIHKSISNKIDHYKFWNDTIIETRLKTQQGHLTILGVYAPTKGRDELNEEFSETLQKVLDKVNRRLHKVDRGRERESWKQ